MPQNPKKFYIKERMNPQTGTYYIMEGQLSQTAAKRKARGRSLYGGNKIHAFNTEAEYEAKLTELRSAGESVI